MDHIYEMRVTQPSELLSKTPSLIALRFRSHLLHLTLLCLALLSSELEVDANEKQIGLLVRASRVKVRQQGGQNGNPTE
jgi:hypothetical protein